jgi:LacI family transcriptional regulator
VSGRAGTKGSRREPRLVEVAERAGVHVSTASRALNPERRSLVNVRTAARVMEAARELGYTVDLVARGLKRGRSGTIGVVVTDFGNPFVGPLLRGIEDAVEPTGQVAVVVETRDDPVRLRHHLRTLASRRVDGFIVTAARDGDSEVLRSISERGTPVVLAVRDLEGSGLPAVVLDDELGGSIVAEHLALLGHRRVAEVAGQEDIVVFRRRHRGFRRTCAALGVEMLPAPFRATEPTVADGRRVTRMVLDLDGPPPSAIFCHNDQMAAGALEVIAERGLACPRDISVVGFNDAPLTASLAPPLTTVRVPSQEMGRIAGQMAVAAMDDPSTRVRSVLLQPELVLRASTAPHPTDGVDAAAMTAPAVAVLPRAGR